MASTKPLAFGWKLPCRVKVTQVAEKKGHTARLTFVLSIEDTGPHLEVSMADMRMLEVDDVEVTPSMERMLSGVFSAVTLIKLIVTHEGQYARLQGADEMIDFSVRLLGKEHVREFMSSPAMKEQLSRNVGDEYWNTWVGFWVGVDLGPGETRTTTTEVPVGDRTVPMNIRLERRADAPGGFVRLKLRATSEGSDVPEAVAAFLGGLAIDSAKSTSFIQAELDPLNLLPIRTKRRRVIEATVDGVEGERIEVAEDTFDWSTAVGCR